MIRGGALQFEASRQVLGIDPAPGQIKDLLIRIRHWDGKTEEFAFPEKSMVNLELDPDAGYDFRERGFHIMRAYYGGEGHFVNVTERMRHLIENGRLRTRVDNEHIGVGPDPHVRKVLRILYWYQGERTTSQSRKKRNNAPIAPDLRPIGAGTSRSRATQLRLPARRKHKRPRVGHQFPSHFTQKRPCFLRSHIACPNR